MVPKIEFLTLNDYHFCNPWKFVPANMLIGQNLWKLATTKINMFTVAVEFRHSWYVSISCFKSFIQIWYNFIAGACYHNHNYQTKYRVANWVKILKVLLFSSRQSIQVNNGTHFSKIDNQDLENFIKSL